MKAIRIHSFGGPDVLQLEDLPIPDVASDEVLVKVCAASVNPVDYKIRAGKFSMAQPDELPKILGRDISGVIERAGKAVTQFRVGDQVLALLDRDHGGYAEYVAVKAALCARKPRVLDHVHAAAVPLAGLTAWQGLFDHGNLRPRQSVLIHGGAGGVGHMAVQLAKICGATVYTTVAFEDLEFARELGADLAIDYKGERFEDVVRDVDLVFDLIGGDIQDRSWIVLKEGATLVSTVSRPSDDKTRARKARGQIYVTQPNAAELADIAQLIDEGKVRPCVQAAYPLQAASVAQLDVEREHTRGKVVLKVAA
jgi:NADPH:quinone reductase-like Zn-dependent oxidoreductase